jgi:ADP-heptose:LPS heptosyltransferase
MRNMFKMLKVMKQLGYCRIYDLQSNSRSRMLCALSGIKEKVGNHPIFPYTHHPQERWEGQSHIFLRMRSMLKQAGIQTEETHPFLPGAPATVDAIRAWMEISIRPTKHFVLLHAGASPKRPEKKWPFFSDLALKLLEKDFDVVWIGGSADKDLNEELSAGCGINATNQFSILELAELGRHAAFAVTNDSGPMHVLSASAIPVFGIYGPSDWRRNHALLQSNRVITPPNIGGEQKSTSSLEQDITTITPKMVLERLKRENLIP